MKYKIDKSVIIIFNDKVIDCNVGDKEYHINIAQYIINDNFSNAINLLEEMKRQKNNWASIICDYYDLIVIMTDKPSALIYLPNSISIFQISKLKEIYELLSKDSYYKSISYKKKAYESDNVINILLDYFSKNKTISR